MNKPNLRTHGGEFRSLQRQREERGVLKREEKYAQRELAGRVRRRRKRRGNNRH